MVVKCVIPQLNFTVKEKEMPLPFITSISPLNLHCWTLPITESDDDVPS